jgi:hypothetical protein
MAKVATKQAQQNAPDKVEPTTAPQEVEPIVAAKVDAPAGDRPAPRRAPGQKEVIPFEWKLCGYSSEGYTLTLFKSIERADCEAQLLRHEAEGYYHGLKVYKLDETVPPSPKAKKLRVAAKKAKHDSTAAQNDGPAVRKSAKAAPSVIQTAMGKLIDGRITARLKKGAREAAEKAAIEKSARRSARKGSSAALAKSKTARRPSSAAASDKATEKKVAARAPSQKTSSKPASAATTKKKTTSRSATSTKKKTTTTRKKRKR